MGKFKFPNSNYRLQFVDMTGQYLMQDKKEVQHQISILLFVGLTCGVFMFLFMRFLGAWALTGNKNSFF